MSRVQATPVFPTFVNYPDIVARLFAHVCRTGLFAAGTLDAHVERLELLREAYDAGLTGLVSSHNDSIPSNILFDGERLWLIDWESAYRNDPLVDVAIVLDSLVRSPAFIMQASCSARPRQRRGSRTIPICPAPTVDGFQQAIRSGRLKPGAPQTKHVLGKMFLASFMSGGDTPWLDAAV